MVRTPRRGMDDVPREIAPDVYCLGPSGRTQTNVYIVRSGSSGVLIDTGWAGDAQRIEQAVESLFGSPPTPKAILLTHVHPDHSGSALDLARSWDCPVYMHPKELPIANANFAAMSACAGPLDRWLVLPLMRTMGERRRAAMLADSNLGEVAHSFDPGENVPGLPDWVRVPTPGHTPGHVSYFRPKDRVLITGDAVVTMKVNSPLGLVLQQQGLSGPPWYTTWSRRAADESVSTLASLKPTVLAGGHGLQISGPQTASRLRALARRSGHQ